MGEYVLSHHLEGEGKRLALMANRSIPCSAGTSNHLTLARAPGRWLRQRVDLRVVCSARRARRRSSRGVRSGSVPRRRARAAACVATRRHCSWAGGSRHLRSCDRAVLHHVADAEAAIANLVASLRPGGALVLIERDFLPVSVAEPPERRRFWDGWLAWSRERGIDYHIGRTLAPRLGALGSLEQIRGAAETAVYNGVSPWANYWTQTIVELRGDLVSSGNSPMRSWTRFSVTAQIQIGGHKRLPSRLCTPAHVAPD
jgi:hypothetical protein